jgi:predicted TIM-barrel fold metal-dependent hydrolase
MLLAGVPDRHPDLSIIVPHGGAALPVLADRVSLMAPMLSLAPTPPGHFLAQLKSLYYDLAGAPLPRQLPALLSIADPDKLLYGSDAAFTPWPAIKFLLGQLQTTPTLTDTQRTALFTTNATKLFPRFCA